MFCVYAITIISLIVLSHAVNSLNKYSPKLIHFCLAVCVHACTINYVYMCFYAHKHSLLLFIYYPDSNMFMLTGIQVLWLSVVLPLVSALVKSISTMLSVLVLSLNWSIALTSPSTTVFTTRMQESGVSKVLHAPWRL